MEIAEKIVGYINGWVWGPWMLILLFGTHVYMTFKTGFIQKKLGLGIRLSVTRDSDEKVEGDVSQFGALTTALAATIGTGNIVGVGTAVALGGPGAVLWMWLTGVFGIATKYAESLIAVKYRVKTEDGTILGGAMFALERGLNMRWLGILFALFTALAAFGIGSGVQSNAVADLMYRTFEFPKWVAGLIMMIFVGIVVLGGIKSIAKVCEKMMPFVSALYVIGCVVLLVIYRDYLGAAVMEILNDAFAPKAAGGGLIGAGVMAAARYGIARGLFSNESGMGSAPIVAAAAQTRNPARQALVSMTGTFWDTVVICLLSGLVIVSAVVANPEIDYSAGGALTHAAFNQIPYGIGVITLTFGLATFAFSTILGWSYYGERGAEYLFGNKINLPYRLIFTIVVFVGCVVPLGLAWDVADMLNGLMVVPNVIAVLLLRQVIADDTKTYVSDKTIDNFDETPLPTTGELHIARKTLRVAKMERESGKPLAHISDLLEKTRKGLAEDMSCDRNEPTLEDLLSAQKDKK